jgi:hypothetical protein
MYYKLSLLLFTTGSTAAAVSTGSPLYNIDLAGSTTAIAAATCSLVLLLLVVIVVVKT